MPATIGDNSKNELTPAQRKAIYMQHFNAILIQTEVCKAENAVRLKLRKEAKADGIILADIDFGLRCAQIQDPQVIIDEQRRRAEIGKFFALPIGTQGEFELDREPLVDRATRDGEAAGYRALDPDANPHDPNSEPGRAWLAAWKAAQAQMLEDFQQGMLIQQAKRANEPAAARDDDGENDPPDDDSE